MTSATMRPYLPSSLIAFPAIAAVFVLQMFPVTGVFLMMIGAPFWSVLLINAGMIGTAIEAATGRVSRWWLVLPLAFYGGYWSVAAKDHLALASLSSSFDQANAQVQVPFDPEQHALVFGRGESGWLTQNYNLDVMYSENENFPERHLSYRLLDASTCSKVRNDRALRAAFVNTFGFHDGDGARRFEQRFCNLSMPEQPKLPAVRVSEKVENVKFGDLPVTRKLTTITMPGNSERFHLLGGVAAPLSWIPMPVLGCTLISSGPSWECFAQFQRSGFTPIVSGDTRYNRDTIVLARALGLKPVPVAERKGADPSIVFARAREAESATLKEQLSNIDAMIADPLAKVRDWQTSVVTARPDILVQRAAAIMSGLARAAGYDGKDFYRARESGRILARLMASLPDEKFGEFRSRLGGLYATANNKHWLWEVPSLRERLGIAAPGASR